MPGDAASETGGKGNRGMYIDREPRICAAGVPSSQPHDSVAELLQTYLMQDEVDALIHDSIHPPPPPLPRPPLRRPIPCDLRFAGLGGAVGQLINPPDQTKFQNIVEDMKNTSFASYFKKPLGKSKDPVPMLPDGFDAVHTTFGKKTPFEGRLYDIVMPKVPLPDKTPEHKYPGVQVRKRNYCVPPFGDLTYGHRTGQDPRGRRARCCLTDDNVILGKGERCVVDSRLADFHEAHRSKTGKVYAPFNNVAELPPGHAFGITSSLGNITECLTTCEINPNVAFVRKCLGHINTVKKVLSKRFTPTFFRNFYLSIRYYDKENTGWLPKDVVYNLCAAKLIRFNPALVEPLLCAWNAFDGTCVEYKTFVHVLNYKEPLPDLPKVIDIKDDCLHFTTEYREMVKPNQDAGREFMAGLPSGRFFDMDYPITPWGMCKADRTYLPQESDAQSNLNPSIMSRYNVTHRDMYAERDAATVRRVFEKAGETFTDESFMNLWKEAQQYHPDGIVCYETFRRVLDKKDEK